jgi:exopolysaccharide/PEP-CTERM locus tyrosine autokinase
MGSREKEPRVNRSVASSLPNGQHAGVENSNDADGTQPCVGPEGTIVVEPHVDATDSPQTLADGERPSPLSPVIDGRRLKLNFENLERAGVFTQRSGSYRLAEELRHIKRRLLINASDFGEGPIDRSNLIMVTSAGPSEGKTYVAANLAVSIELEIDRTVLLVDCDTVKMATSRLFGVYDRPGLSDLLMRPDLDIAQVLCRTDLDDLTILPAGSRVTHINEHMASQRMQRLITEMATRYDDRIVVLDSPPLLATSETSVLARLVGQIVIVVAAGQTKQADFLAALDQVDPAKISGLILNRSDEKPETSYYESYFLSEQKYLESG